MAIGIIQMSEDLDFLCYIFIDMILAVSVSVLVRCIVHFWHLNNGDGGRMYLRSYSSQYWADLKASTLSTVAILSSSWSHSTIVLGK